MFASTFAVVTGGGTAGHVLPALAIADGLVANGHRADEIVYIGARRGIETRLLPASPYAHHFLDVVGLRRSLTAANLLMPFKLVMAVIAARSLLRTLRPAVVVSVGGYASLPATVAARWRRTPIVVVSYDFAPGLATRLSARFATVCATAFEGSSLPRARCTGAPVRPELVRLDRRTSRDAARRRLGLPLDRFVIAAFGGSLGSGVLNDAVKRLLDDLSDRSDIAVRHVVGDRFVRDAAAERSGEQGIMYDVIGYEDRMVDVYAAADLMITRAGASTIAELTTTGTPAIVVPWSGSAKDHQSDNARFLADRDAAIVITEFDLVRDGLTATVTGLIDDLESLEQIAAAAYATGESHRSGRLTELIEDVAAGR